MTFRNCIDFKVWGEYALFTDPLTKIGGEKYSYPIPTYQALKGIVEGIYWKPTITWVIDKVRIMKPICTQSKGIKPRENDGSSELSLYTYLSNVEYHCEAHFVFNEHRPELAQDRNENKHYFMAKRILEKGGRRDIFLGARECQGYVEPCGFDSGTGAYDSLESMKFGVMLHGLNYPDETGRKVLEARLWQPEMRKGIIEFCTPDACPIVRKLRSMEPKEFELNHSVQS
ncbi:MAG: type I-C CRISPR-associated protein Cas5c, partial [Sphaerochaetaceae bacterium]